MKSQFAIFLSRSFLDTLGLLAVLLLFTANAFHFDIYMTCVFYRELFGVLFIALTLWYLLMRTHVLRWNVLRMNRALFFLLIFPVLLGLWSFIDPGVPLYDDYEVEGTTLQLGDAGLSLYVLRNALLYLPMVVYFYLRGVTEKEIRLIALLAIVVAPFSIGAYLQSGEIATLSTLGLIAQTGEGGGIAYNSYVPYLTFSVMCGIFLLFSRTSFLLKLIVLPCVVVTGIFCLFSTSRQSVLFIVVILAAAFYFTKEGRHPRGKWFNLAVLVLVGVVSFSYFTQGYGLADNFVTRFGSAKGLTETPRLTMAVDGLMMLNLSDWFMGAGLTSVITSGPHNDYVRWSQRVGVPLMILGFMPFFIAFRVCCRLVRRNRSDNTLFIFLAMVVGFTLFHSFFGYPREDANQAVAVYLGLSMWFGALREGLLKSVSIISLSQQHLSQARGAVQSNLAFERPAS